MHTLTRFHVTSPKAKESRKFLSLSGILKEKISFKLFYNSFTNIPDAETIKLHWYTKQICYCPVFLHWAEVQWNSCSKGLCLFFTLGRQPYPVRYLDNQFRLRSVWQCIQMLFWTRESYRTTPCRWMPFLRPGAKDLCGPMSTEHLRSTELQASTDAIINSLYLLILF